MTSKTNHLFGTAAKRILGFAAMQQAVEQAKVDKATAASAVEPVESKKGRKRQNHYIGIPGRPTNVLNSGERGPWGSVLYRSAIKISDRATAKTIAVIDPQSGTTARVPLVAKTKGPGSQKYVVPLIPAVDLRVFNQTKNDIRRKAMGRFVGPFPTHGDLSLGKH